MLLGSEWLSVFLGFVKFSYVFHLFSLGSLVISSQFCCEFHSCVLLSSVFWEYIVNLRLFIKRLRRNVAITNHQARMEIASTVGQSAKRAQIGVNQLSECLVFYVCEFLMLCFKDWRNSENMK